MKNYLMFALAGFALGVLFAPKKGSLLRQEIKDCFGEMQKNGTETLEEAQRKGREISGQASLVLDQAREEAKILKSEGEEILRDTTANLQESYDRSQAALQQAQERVVDVAAPAMDMVKEEAKELTKRAAEFFQTRTLREHFN